MKKDTNFYDAESSKYSAKRYPKVAQNRIQHFFKSRLSIILCELQRYLRPNSTLLEIGCADGIIIRSIYDKFSGMLVSAEGVDISPGMIEVARSLLGDRKISFALRNELEQRSFDYVIEVGVVNYADFEEEMSHVCEILSPDGIYICSLAGTDSLSQKLNPAAQEGFRNFLSYSEYEKGLQQHFEIVAAKPVGLFIPYIWAIPAAARLIQPLMEKILSLISPNLFLEKVYVLRRR